jgi:uncharacterized phage-associated protein
MAQHPFSVARYLCERSNWTLTNLKLQKLLYLTQMFYVGQEKVPLINGRFEAWDFGPVQPDVYAVARSFGRDAVKDVFQGYSLPTAGLALIDDVWDATKNMSAGKLVEITHWSKGAWAKCYRPSRMSIEIPLSLIAGEYDARTKKS